MIEHLTPRPYGEYDQAVADAYMDGHTAPPQGVKHDQGKPDYTLLPMDALEEVVKVLAHGAQKYSRDNWRHVAAERYHQAAWRHRVAHTRGDLIDEDSGCLHLAMEAANALIALQLHLMGASGE